MKKQRLPKKALRIVSIQRGISAKIIAKEIGITYPSLAYAVNHLSNKNHKVIAKYLKDNLLLEINPKIHCIMNDMSFSEYCLKNNINYQDFVYERVV